MQSAGCVQAPNTASPC